MAKVARPVTPADYDKQMKAASMETIRRSRDLLDRTEPVVTATVGGSVIGSRPFDTGQCEPCEMKH